MSDVTGYLSNVSPPMVFIPKRKMPGLDTTQPASPSFQSFISQLTIGTAKITTAMIQDLAVETGKIANLAVTNAKIESLAVTNAKIESLVATKITGQIVDAQIANIEWAKIENAIITDAIIDSCSITKLTAGNLVVTGTITTGKLVTGAAGTNRIEVTSARISGINSSNVTQFYLRASDGKAYCGGGAVVLDSAGIKFTGAYLSFYDGANRFGRIYGWPNRLVVMGDTDVMISTGRDIELVAQGGAGEIITTADVLRPVANGAYDLGTSSRKWKTLYAINADLTGAGYLDLPVRTTPPIWADGRTFIYYHRFNYSAHNYLISANHSASTWDRYDIDLSF